MRFPCAHEVLSSKKSARIKFPHTLQVTAKLRKLALTSTEDVYVTKISDQTVFIAALSTTYTVNQKKTGPLLFLL